MGAASKRTRFSLQLLTPSFPTGICTGLSRAEVLAEVGGMRWGDFKPRLADAVVAHLQPIQQRYAEVMEDEGALDAILAQVSTGVWSRAEAEPGAALPFMALQRSKPARSFVSCRWHAVS